MCISDSPVTCVQTASDTNELDVAVTTLERLLSDAENTAQQSTTSSMTPSDVLPSYGPIVNVDIDNPSNAVDDDLIRTIDGLSLNMLSSDNNGTIANPHPNSDVTVFPLDIEKDWVSNEDSGIQDSITIESGINTSYSAPEKSVICNYGIGRGGGKGSKFTSMSMHSECLNDSRSDGHSDILSDTSCDMECDSDCTSDSDNSTSCNKVTFSSDVRRFPICTKKLSTVEQHPSKSPVSRKTQDISVSNTVESEDDGVVLNCESDEISGDSLPRTPGRNVEMLYGEHSLQQPEEINVGDVDESDDPGAPLMDEDPLALPKLPATPGNTNRTNKEAELVVCLKKLTPKQLSRKRKAHFATNCHTEKSRCLKNTTKDKKPIKQPPNITVVKKSKTVARNKNTRTATSSRSATSELSDNVRSILQQETFSKSDIKTVLAEFARCPMEDVDDLAVYILSTNNDSYPFIKRFKKCAKATSFQVYYAEYMRLKAKSKFSSNFAALCKSSPLKSAWNFRRLCELLPILESYFANPRVFENNNCRLSTSAYSSLFYMFVSIHLNEYANTSSSRLKKIVVAPNVMRVLTQTAQDVLFKMYYEIDNTGDKRITYSQIVHYVTTSKVLQYNLLSNFKKNRQRFGSKYDFLVAEHRKPHYVPSDVRLRTLFICHYLDNLRALNADNIPVPCNVEDFTNQLQNDNVHAIRIFQTLYPRNVYSSFRTIYICLMDYVVESIVSFCREQSDLINASTVECNMDNLISIQSRLNQVISHYGTSLENAIQRVTLKNGH